MIISMDDFLSLCITVARQQKAIIQLEEENLKLHQALESPNGEVKDKVSEGSIK
jgi:hypothetical protein